MKVTAVKRDLSDRSFIYQENILLKKRIAELEKLLAAKNPTCYETRHAESTTLAEVDG